MLEPTTALPLGYEDIMARLPAYVSGTLPTEELLTVHDYLEQHQRLLTHLEAAELAQVEVARERPGAPLPDEAKAALFARLAPSEAPRVALRPTPRATRPALALRALATAALLLLLLGGSYTLGARQERTQQQQVVQGLRQALSTEQERATMMQRVISRADYAVSAAGTEAAPHAHATFFLSGQEAVVAVQGLDEPPAGSAYQLWLMTDEGEPTPAGMLPIADASPAVVATSLPRSADGYGWVGVTLEPAGGSPQPTGDVLIIAALP